MAVRTIRKIIHIDEAKCNGCGKCTTACAEGALQLVNGKARLISETYCDGLGACLGECPQGAIRIEEREALGFDEEAVKVHTAKHEAHALACGCPGSAVREIEHGDEIHSAKTGHQASRLRNFPVQLALVPPSAPFLKNADLLLASDCVPFAYAGFHDEFLAGNTLLIACPKLDDFEAHLAKLTEILRQSNSKSLTVVRMEVPCCSGLTYMVKEAIKTSGLDVPFEEIIVSVRGDIKK